MSSYKIYPIVFCLALLSSGCGFRPLYAPPLEDQNGQSIYAFDILKKVSIDSIPNREGQYFRNKLTQLLHPAGRNGEALYVLQITLHEATQNLAVKRTAIATRANLTITANFNLITIGSEKNDKSGMVRSSSGYNIFQSEFQTLLAEKGARNRALDDLAQQMRIRLAAILTSNEANTTKP